MPLPAPQPRTLHHTRKVTFHGYRRDDGLWDIEAELCDTKAHAFEIDGEGRWEADQPLHLMRMRVTVDTGLVVQEIAVAMDGVPHAECPQAAAPLQRMVGHTLGRGWRKAIDHHLGGVQGCAHLRELLFNVATAALQTVPGGFDTTNTEKPPMYLGQCLAWDFNGPLVERRYPVFFQWPSKASQAK